MANENAISLASETTKKWLAQKNWDDSLALDIRKKVALTPKENKE